MKEQNLLTEDILYYELHNHIYLNFVNNNMSHDKSQNERKNEPTRRKRQGENSFLQDKRAPLGSVRN